MPMILGVGCGGTITAPSTATRCRFWEPSHATIGEPSITNGTCHRYPTPETTHRSYYCGEYMAPL